MATPIATEINTEPTTSLPAMDREVATAGGISKKLSPARTIFACVFGLVLLFLFASPNFQSGTFQRSEPLGSDFLQEWTGGYIWLNHRSELYSTDRFVSVQHDSMLVGFEWPAEKFYPMVYPPFYYMMFSPLTAMPYNAAMVVWMLSLAAVIATTLWMWTTYYPPARNHSGKCLLASLVFYPMLMSLNTAHKSAFLLFILTATYLLMFRGRSFLAGMVFGLIAFKPHLGLVIGVTMLLKRQWHFIAGCAISVGSLCLLSLLAGWDLCQDYFWQCLSMTDYTSTAGYQLTQSHSLLGVLGLMFGTDSVATSVLFNVLTLVSIAAVWFAMRGKINTSSNRFAMQFSLLIVATVLLSPHFYVYDLAIMLLPIGLIAFTCGHTNSDSVERTPKLELTRKLVLFCTVAIFALVGLSANIAAATAVQPTLPILTAMAVGLTICSSQLRDKACGSV